jgi:uncharacterized membrane protein
MRKLYLKIALGFAALSYLATLGLYLVPSVWHLTPKTVYAICPACVLTITVDPSFASVALILAPIDAIVYGSIGLMIGLIVHELRR